MRIIIAGAGEVGTHLAEIIAKENHDVVVIDPDEDKLNLIDNQYDILTVQGSSTSFEILEEAKIKGADLLIAVTRSEEVNLMTAIFGKEMGVKKTIARIDNKEFLQKKNEKYYKNMGVDSVICPENLASSEIVGLLKQTGTTEVFEFSGGKLSLFVIKLDEKAPIIGKTLSETGNMIEGFDFRAVAVSRKNKSIIPSGDFIFQPGDFIYVITNQEGIQNVLWYSGKEKFDITNIMILGGSRIGKRTAKALEGHLNIKLVEIDKEKSFKLADFLSKSLIINGDGSNMNLLMEEGIQNMDAFIAVTGNAETNILSCLLAKRLGVKKTIAEIENIDYIDLAENIGIDTIINKKLLAASHIFGYTMRAEVSSLKCLTGADAEVMELVAHDNSSIIGIPLKDSKFPKEAIIGGVVRGKKCFIAKGDTVIEPNDKVVIFSLPGAIQKVQDFFK